MNPDIADQINTICLKLGIDPLRVAKLTITPRELVADVYRLDDGKKFVDPDTGKAAIDQSYFAIRT